MTAPTLAKSKKAPLTLYVEHRTAELLQETLEAGSSIDMMRDYWYGMKDDAELRRYRTTEDDEGWSDKITNIIRKFIENIALNGNPAIYEQLGLESKVLEAGEAPIIVIFEKQKKEALSIVESYHAGYAFSRGQFPTFEASHVAAYLERCKYSIGYVFVLTDYDPAGEHLFKQVERKMKKFTTTTEIKTIHVNFGENALEEFETYTLTSNGLNRKWIEAGRTKGIEFNTPKNISAGILTYLKQSIMDNVDPRIFVDISYQKWISWQRYYISIRDEYYQKMKESIEDIEHKIAWREIRHSQIAAYTKACYLFESPSEYDTVKEDEENENDPKDLQFYECLLGDDNPHSEKYRRTYVRKLAINQRYI